MRLLVIEDDPDIRDLLVLVLREEGYAVDASADAFAGSVAAMTSDYDGIVMDFMLPDRSGPEVIQQLRREGRNVPVLMLSSRSTTQDIVRGLDAGADDYMVKPFEVAELKARMRALLRRGGAVRSDQLARGNVVVNRQTRQALIGGRRVDLTPKELGMLELLLLHYDEVVPRSLALGKVWERDRDPDSNVIDALVARLRSKLRSGEATVEIATVRGFGFRMEPRKAAQR